MKIENNRLRLIIFHLMNSDKPLTSDVLSGLISVSPRTVKTDMLLIKDNIGEIGAELITRKGVGYSINIINRELFDPFYEQLIYYRMLLGTFMTDRIARFVYIARTLVASEDYIKIEDIADEMYLSNSSVKQEMKAIYSFLNSYHLQIDSKVGKGIKVIGSEENRRLAIVELVVNRYHKIKVTDSSENYARILDCTEDLRQKIRRNFLKTFRNSGIYAVDDETLRFAFYLVVLMNRIKEGHTIEFNQDVYQELIELKEYKVANDVIENLREIGGFEVSNHEIAFIALMFHSMRDIKIDEVDTNNSNYDETVILVNDVIKELNQVWNINFNEMRMFKDYLIAKFIPIIAQIKYGLSSNQRVVADLSAHEIGGSPLSIEISRTIMRIVETKYFCRLNSHLLTKIAFVVYSSISRVKYDIKKMKLLTVSTGGKESSIELIERLNNRFSNMIESNEAVELYEIRGLDQTKYDCVIMNEPDFSYFYSIPYFKIDTVTQPNTLSRFYDEVLINTFQIDDYIPDCDKTHVYNSFVIESQSSFFKMIAYKYGKDSTNCSLIEEMLNENEKFFSYNVDYETVIIFLPFKMCRSESIDYYHLNDSKSWGVSDITNIVVIITDFNQNIHRLKALENISRILITNSKTVEYIENAPCHSQYRKLLQSSLTSE